MYERSFIAGWGDMDFNGHMRNTAYLDRAADTRMMYFADHGFPMRQFAQLRLGPVVMRDEIDYYKEIALLETMRVRLSIAGLSADGSRFRLCNECFRDDGRLAARVSSLGGWLDLGARRLIRPPDALLAALRSLERTEEFAELESSVRD